MEILNISESEEFLIVSEKYQEEGKPFTIRKRAINKKYIFSVDEDPRGMGSLVVLQIGNVPSEENMSLIEVIDSWDSLINPTS